MRYCELALRSKMSAGPPGEINRRGAEAQSYRREKYNSIFAAAPRLCGENSCLHPESRGIDH